MTSEEREEYITNFPALRMFANATIDSFGEEAYREIERKSIEKIRTRAWENE